MPWQSVPGFGKPSFKDIHEALGVTKFDSEDETKWAQVIGGLTIQGGFLEAAGVVEFHAAYDKQVLGIFINNGNVTAVDLTKFTSSVSGYWWAIGL